MVEKLFNDLWPQLKKQGLFVLTLLLIIYYFNNKVTSLESDVHNCNQETYEQFVELQKQTLTILERLDLKTDLMVIKKENTVQKPYYIFSKEDDIVDNK